MKKQKFGAFALVMCRQLSSLCFISNFLYHFFKYFRVTRKYILLTIRNSNLLYGIIKHKWFLDDCKLANSPQPDV